MAQNSLRVDPAAFSVYLGTGDHYVSQAQYAERIRFRDVIHNRQTTISQNATSGEPTCMVEPITGILTLRPVWDTTADTDDTGTVVGGTWRETENLFGSDCVWMAQTDATAGETSYTSASFEANRSLFVDLYLYESTAETYKVQIDWGGIWRLMIWRDGRAELSAKPDGATDYTVYAAGRIAAANQQIMEQHLRVGLRCIGRQTVLVWCNLINDERDCLNTREAPSDFAMGANAPYTIFAAGTCKVTVSGGAYNVGIRGFKYPVTGSLTGPVVVMRELVAAGYVGTPTLTEDAILPTGTALTHALTDADGSAFGGGADKTIYRNKLTLTAGGTGEIRTPEVIWAALRIEPIATPTGTTAVDISDNVVRISETLSLENHLHTVALELKPGTLETYRTISNLRGRLVVANAERCTFYAKDPEYSIAEGYGQVKFLECENRLAKLKQAIISDKRAYDGMAHTDAVRDLLLLAGVDAADISIGTDPLGRTLPTPKEADTPLFCWTNGTTAFEAIKYICDVFSGWSLFMEATTDDSWTFNYADKRYIGETLADLATGNLFESSRAEDTLGQWPNGNHIFAFAQKVDTTQYYNEIWVVGENEAGEVLTGFWQDATGWTTAPTIGATETTQYVGERRKLIYIDPAMNSAAVVEDVLAILKYQHGKPKRTASFKSGYSPLLKPGDVVYLPEPSAAYWRIESITTEINRDSAFADYEVAYLGT